VGRARPAGNTPTIQFFLFFSPPPCFRLGIGLNYGKRAWGPAPRRLVLMSGCSAPITQFFLDVTKKLLSWAPRQEGRQARFQDAESHKSTLPRAVFCWKHLSKFKIAPWQSRA